MNGKQLKNSILQWAIQGKLVPQDAGEEPAIELLKRLNPKVKPITEDVPFEVPESWVWAKISDIAFVTKLAGFEYTKHIANNLKSSGVPLFKGKNVQDGKIIYEFESYIPESLSDELERSQIRKKCLLTPYVGTIGNIGIHDKQGKFHLGSNVGKIELLNTEKETYIYEEYVHFYLRSSYGYSELTKFKKATAQESISIQAIREVYIPIPPTNEQKRIVEKIEELMPLVERYTKAQEGLDKLNAGIRGKLRASILQEAIHGKLVPQDANDEPAIELLKRINPKFVQLEYDEELPKGWCITTLSSVASIYTGNSINEQEKKIKYTGLTEGYNYIATKDVGFNHSIDYENGIKIPFDTNFRIAKRGTILLCIEGGSAGRKIGILTQDVCFVNKLCAFESIGLYNRYLYYYLLSPNFKSIFIDKTSGLIGGVSQKNLRSISIPIPPLAEQKRIVAKIEELFGVLGRL